MRPRQKNVILGLLLALLVVSGFAAFHKPPTTWQANLPPKAQLTGHR